MDEYRRSLYSREKKELLDQLMLDKKTLASVIPPIVWDQLYDFTIDAYFQKQVEGALYHFEKRYALPDEPMSNRNHHWIGINPPPDSISLKELYSLTDRATKKYKFLSKYAYVAEAHTENGFRPHIHMMAITDEKPNRVITALANHYAVERSSIHCKAFKKGHLFGEHYDYITNLKTDSKDMYVQADINERNANDITHFSSNIQV